MPSSILARFLKKFSGGILRTTSEKWIDGLAFGATLLYLWVFGKPSSFWEAAEPFVWLVCLICAIHVLKAGVKVWRDTRRGPPVPETKSPILLTDADEPRTPIAKPYSVRSLSKLLAILLISLLLLLLLSYSVRRLAIASVRTYIYLVPTAGLMECQKRAFFIKMIGPQVLYNVTVVLKDNKSGQTYSQTYTEIDPGSQSSDMYFWFTPSSPWDEDYTATVTTRESHSSEKIVLRSVQQRPQFAMQITLDQNIKPTVACRDTLLPGSYTLAATERHACAELMNLPGDVPSKLDVYSYQLANGNVTIRKGRTLPTPSELDDRSDDRHITEYQRQIIEPVLKRYGGSHILMYFAGGQKSKAYAEEFHKMFTAMTWVAKGPTLVPLGDERIIDVQMSVNYQENWSKYNPKPHEVWDAFQKAGIKQRRRLIMDPNVPSDVIVLWVGPRSPSDLKPNQCLPAEMKPVEGEPHTCEMLSATDGECPFPPK
jgi:hypothetical protein